RRDPTTTRHPGRTKARPYDPRLPGRTKARPYEHAYTVAPRRDPTAAPYYVDNQPPALHPHACPVAPRRDPTTAPY
ncbi:MAG: hypothetical protein SPJ71_07560, partial [Candidatus Limisoma sp.]|nr:hypothetical protein [Bacteroidales bacterium]MDY5894402.1 hypothetical protein [Candidatus Limisoma sp.]